MTRVLNRSLKLSILNGIVPTANNRNYPKGKPDMEFTQPSVTTNQNAKIILRLLMSLITILKKIRATMHQKREISMDFPTLPSSTISTQATKK